jgi:hypothetical protein
MRPVIGIDPGLEGGLACLGDHGLQIEVMPTVGATKLREIDIPQTLRLLRGWRETLGARHLIIEKVSARPGNGVQGMFRFGVGVGVVKGLAVALDFSITEVMPTSWHRRICAGMPAGDPKGNARKRVSQLWPNVSFLRTPRSSLPHDGMVDAALIAAYGADVIAGIGGGR